MWSPSKLSSDRCAPLHKIATHPARPLFSSHPSANGAVANRPVGFSPLGPCPSRGSQSADERHAAKATIVEQKDSNKESQTSPFADKKRSQPKNFGHRRRDSTGQNNNKRVGNRRHLQLINHHSVCNQMPLAKRKRNSRDINPLRPIGQQIARLRLFRLFW